MSTTYVPISYLAWVLVFATIMFIERVVYARLLRIERRKVNQLLDTYVDKLRDKTTSLNNCRARLKESMKDKANLAMELRRAASTHITK